jgi:hypothetical protein
MDADARGTGVLDVEAWLNHEAEREARLWDRCGCDFDKVGRHERDLHAPGGCGLDDAPGGHDLDDALGRRAASRRDPRVERALEAQRLQEEATRLEVEQDFNRECGEWDAGARSPHRRCASPSSD